MWRRRRSEMKRTFGKHEFHLLGNIELVTDDSGSIKEFMPHDRYKNAATSKLNRYGRGPFCKFRMAKGVKSAGLYVLTVGSTPKYVGECVDADKRWRSNGYGGISPRNPFVGGQPTNCRINSAILTARKSNSQVELWFRPVHSEKQIRVDIETSLIELLDPTWNVAKRAHRKEAHL